MTEGQRALLEKLVEVLLSRRGADPPPDRYKSLKNMEDVELRRRRAAWYFLEERILFIFMLVVVCGLTCSLIYIAVFTLQPPVNVYVLTAFILVATSLWRRIIARF